MQSGSDEARAKLDEQSEALVAMRAALTKQREISNNNEGYRN